MKSEKTTKQDKEAAGTPIVTSSPTGHEELAQRLASEQLGTDDVDTNQKSKRNPPVHDVPKQDENPKHTDRRPRT